MKFRWYEATSEREEVFEADNATSFLQLVKASLQKLRDHTSYWFGTSLHYPPCLLEVWLEHSKTADRWYPPKVDGLHAAFRAPSRGSVAEKDGPPDDTNLIEDSYLDWWELSSKEVESGKHYAKQQKGP